MSKNISQVYTSNPITSNQAGDLMYFGRSPYGIGDDTAMTFSDFEAQFGTPFTPSALTKSDDTNVTLTLGGSPTTALLQNTSLTLGWTGTLSPARGGTGVNNGSSTLTLGGNLATSGAFASTFTMTNTTTVTFPTSGTLATTSQIPTGAALTKTDDTNVTLSLGGSPATALVNAASLTLGWTGTLGVTRGGTGLASFTQGDILYSSAANTLSALAKNTTATRYISNTGTSNNPAWAQVNLTDGVTGTLPVANGGTGITSLGAGVATWLGTPSSANLAAAVTDETGTGALVFANTPTLVTPALGAATATSINFGGTSLANYVEGSITPTIVSSGGGSVTYATQVGTYTRIGNRVIFSFQIGVSSNSLGAGTITLAGLPINCTGGNVAVSLWQITLSAAAVTQIIGYVVNGTTTIALHKYSAGTTTALANTDLGASPSFIVAGSYQV